MTFFYPCLLQWPVARAMQMAFFSVPARGDAGLQDDLNVFLRSHRVLTVHREFVGHGENAFWALAVEYLDGPVLSGAGAQRGGKERVDYKEMLSPADFTLFAKLRDWRKGVSEKDGVPVYAVLTNEQLSAIAVKRPLGLAALRDIDGLGEAKAAKYGEAVLSLVATAKGADAVAAAPGSVGMEAAPPPQRP